MRVGLTHSGNGVLCDYGMACVENDLMLNTRKRGLGFGVLLALH